MASGVPSAEWVGQAGRRWHGMQLVFLAFGIARGHASESIQHTLMADQAGTLRGHTVGQRFPGEAVGQVESTAGGGDFV
jgi:hypothetical protein